jgi:hypothetical protein
MVDKVNIHKYLTDMKRLFLLFFILQIALLFLYYPDFYGFYDEDLYLTSTYAMQNGSFFYEKAGVPLPLGATAKTDKGTFSIYSPGNSALLLPFTLIHWRLGFLKNILLYIGGFLLFILILRRLNIDPVYSLIFLLHPTLLLYSRTLMSDVPSMFFLLLGIFLLLDKKIVAAGFSFGFLLLLRYPNLIIIIGIFVALLCTKEYKKALFILPGIFFFSLVLLAYVSHTFGYILGPFSMPHAKFFDLSYSIFNLPYYFLSLNILYPGLLLVAIYSVFKNKEISLFVVPAFIVIIFYSFFSYIDTGNNVLEKLVKGQRYMVPVIPLLLLPYLDFLHNKKYVSKVFVFVVSVLFIFDCGIQYKHQQFLKREKKVSDVLQKRIKDTDIVICNFDTDELLNPYFNKTKLIELSEIGKYNFEKLKNDYEISFAFVELRRDKDYVEKSHWIKYFEREGFSISYESEWPIPIIILSESDDNIGQ